MKNKLQINFTTPEQSKRLLDMGIPAWTADCYYYYEAYIPKDAYPNVVPFDEAWTNDSNESGFSEYIDLPCWSAGRLIEIWELCTSTEFKRWLYNGVFMPLIDDCITHLRFALNPDTNINANFSKLKYYE